MPESYYFDADFDGTITSYDTAHFSGCRRDTPTSLECVLIHDINGDGSITLNDEYAPFAPAMSGPGSTVAVSDARSRFGNLFLRTSQRYEPATRLYHFLYRSYDPALGRWLQKDPLGVLAMGGARPPLSNSSDSPVVFVLGRSAGDEYADGLGLYQYGLSDPVDRTDRSGQFSLIELTVRIGAEVWLNASIPGSTALGMWAIRGVMAGIAAYNAYLLATDPDYLAKLSEDVAMCAGIPGMTATMEHLAYLTRYARMVRVAAGGTIEAGESLGAAAARDLPAILLDVRRTKRYAESLETLAHVRQFDARGRGGIAVFGAVRAVWSRQTAAL
jgi:RHS repeat-associated protein